MEKTVDSFKNKNILVIGDSILDVTIDSKAIGLSLESPTLKAKQQDKHYSFGGAYNVVKNIVSLGAKCTFMTLVGNDEYRSILEGFEHPRLNFIPLYEQEYKNVIKQRFWVERGDHKYKFFQLNQGDRLTKDISSENKNKILQYLNKKFDKVLLVDYRNGLLNGNTVNFIMKNCSTPVIASSQMSDNKTNYDLYDGVELICMNSKEFEAVKNYDFKSNLCITKGSEGSSLVLDKNTYTSPTIHVPFEIDTCGAGDCFLSVLCLTDYMKSPNESLYLSNIYAALSITKIGTETPDFHEYLQYVKQNSRNK